MAETLIFTEDKAYYALNSKGEVVAIADHDLLEISGDRSLLECRKMMWESNYLRNPTTTIKPPWLDAAVT